MGSRPNKKLCRAELEAELERLRHRESLFEATESIAQIGHFEWNVVQNRLESCSATFAGFFDTTEKKLAGSQQVVELMLGHVHTDDLERFQAGIEQLKESRSLDLEFRVFGEAGQIRYLHMSVVESLHSVTAKDRVYGTMREQAPHIVLDEDHEFNDSLLKQAENITAFGNFIYDEVEDRYIYASPGCARIHGVTEQEYLASVNSVEDDLSDVHEDDREWVHAEYVKYFNGGSDCRMEYRFYHPDGNIRWIRELLVAMLVKDGKVVRTRGVLQDITEQKAIEMELREAKQNLEDLVKERTRQLASTVSQLEVEMEEREKISAELEFLANHDPLTGLPSLRLCKDRLERALAAARRNQQMAAVMFLDLDGFKAINDNFGHEYGDNVLKATANRIRGEVRETDTVARIGGDEFLVILSALPDISIAERVANSLLLQVSQPIAIDQHEVTVGTSIGIAIYPDDATDSDALIRVADKAMYRVKNTGKNSFGFLTAEQLN